MATSTVTVASVMGETEGVVQTMGVGYIHVTESSVFTPVINM